MKISNIKPYNINSNRTQYSNSNKKQTPSFKAFFADTPLTNKALSHILQASGDNYDQLYIAKAAKDLYNFPIDDIVAKTRVEITG